MNTKLLSMADQDITKMLTDCESLKPKDLIISPLKWKYLVRSVLRGKNTLILGPTRCGKTKAVISVAQSFSEVKEEIVNEIQLNQLKNNKNIKIISICEIDEK